MDDVVARNNKHAYAVWHTTKKMKRTSHRKAKETTFAHCSDSDEEDAEKNFARNACAQRYPVHSYSNSLLPLRPMPTVYSSCRCRRRRRRLNILEKLWHRPHAVLEIVLRLSEFYSSCFFLSVVKSASVLNACACVGERNTDERGSKCELLVRASY